LEAERGESERYVLSLRDELEKLRAKCSEAERYALSLREEVTKVQEAYAELARRTTAQGQVKLAG
jgi:hypothetical protein